MLILCLFYVLSSNIHLRWIIHKYIQGMFNQLLTYVETVNFSIYETLCYVFEYVFMQEIAIECKIRAGAFCPVRNPGWRAIISPRG